MAIRKSHIIFGALALANFAMTAAVAAKLFLPTREERLDEEVEEAGGWPIGFDDEPVEDYEEIHDYCEEFDRVTSMQEHETRKDPIDEGIDNILRYAVDGKTGFEQE